MTKTYICMLLFLSFAGRVQSQSISSATGDQDTEAKKSFNKAVAAIRTSDYSQALINLNQVIQLNSSYTAAYVERGKIYLTLQKPAEARQDFEQAIRLDSSRGEAWFGKGYGLFLNKDYPAASDAFSAAISNGYTEYIVYYYRGIVHLKQQDASSALLDFTFCLDKKNNFSEAYQDRAGAKFLLKDFSGAVNDYEKAIQINPGYALAYANLGSVRKETGDFQGAIDAFNKSLKLDSLQVLVWNKRGVVKYLTGDLEGASADFIRAIKIKPDDAYALNDQAVLLAKESKNKEALTILNKLIAAHPDKGEYYINRGYLKELSGDLEGACADWHKADDLHIMEAKAYLKDCK